jgi:hypothetical protein
MLNFLAWAGLVTFALTLSYDVWSEWLGPRLLSRSWFPGEPDLPAVAGDVDEPAEENYQRVILAGYFTGGAILIVGLLDVSPIQPTCLPYADIIKTYGIGALSLVTGYMWFTEGQNITIPFHKGIRYTVGVITVIIPLYMAACGQGIL